MGLSRIIKEENIKVPLVGKTKTEIILELVEILKEAGSISDDRAVYQAVMEREALSPTGLEAGFAIPHAKTDVAKELALAIGISPEGVEFGAMDGKPSHIFLLIVGPKNQPGQHIESLAEIAKMAQVSIIGKLLKKAPTPKAVMEIFSE